MARALGQLAEELQPAAISGQLSLEEAARIASFADDPETYSALVKIVGSGPIRQAFVRAERERDVAHHAAEVRAELEGDGVRIIERPAHNDVAFRLNVLTGEDGEDLDAEHHAANCEGHAVYIDDYDGEAIPVCTDPARFGHHTPQGRNRVAKPLVDLRIHRQKKAAARCSTRSSHRGTSRWVTLTWEEDNAATCRSEPRRRLHRLGVGTARDHRRSAPRF